MGKGPAVVSFEADPASKLVRGLPAPRATPTFQMESQEVGPPIRVHLIINPFAGRKRATSIASSVEQGLSAAGVEVILHQTEAPGDAIGMIGALDLKPGDAIAAIGGDGTMSEVITGMMTHLEDPRRVPIALVPAGTGNSQANDLAISTVADAVGRILAGRAHDLDIASVSLHEGLGGDGRRITSLPQPSWGGGLGVDSTIIIAERLRFFGRMRYDIGIILTSRGRRRPARSILDGHVLDDDYTLAGPEQSDRELRTASCSGASVDDGVMDIGILRRMTRRGVLRAFSLLKRDGRHVYLPDVTYHRFKTLRIETDHPTAINIDGENVGTTPLEMTVLLRPYESSHDAQMLKSRSPPQASDLGAPARVQAPVPAQAELVWDRYVWLEPSDASLVDPTEVEWIQHSTSGVRIWIEVAPRCVRGRRSWSARLWTR